MKAFQKSWKTWITLKEPQFPQGACGTLNKRKICQVCNTKTTFLKIVVVVAHYHCFAPTNARALILYTTRNVQGADVELAWRVRNATALASHQPNCPQRNYHTQSHCLNRNHASESFAICLKRSRRLGHTQRGMPVWPSRLVRVRNKPVFRL